MESDQAIRMRWEELAVRQEFRHARLAGGVCLQMGQLGQLELQEASFLAEAGMATLRALLR